jgi:hypothetical protein
VEEAGGPFAGAIPLLVAAESELGEEGVERCADGDSFGGRAFSGEVIELVGDGVAKSFEDGSIERRGTAG